MTSPVDSQRPTISVVVPVYRSEASLRELVERNVAVLRDVAEAGELVLVCDGSPDGSWERIQELALEYPEVVGVELMRNFGQHNALLCGIRAARYELIALMDDDLQNPPEELPKLLAKLREGHDVVSGQPLEKRQRLWRRLTAGVVYFGLRTFLGAPFARHSSSFRLFRSELREGFAEYSSSTVNIHVLLTWTTTRFATVLIRHDPRKIGRSTYNVRNLIAHAVDLITSFSVRPLRFAALVGMAFSALGLALLVFVLGSYVYHGGSLPGFSFLASAIVVFAGVQLFGLGIVGEYIARIHTRSMGKPAYCVRDRTPSALRAQDDVPADEERRTVVGLQPAGEGRDAS